MLHLVIAATIHLTPVSCNGDFDCMQRASEFQQHEIETLQRDAFIAEQEAQARANNERRRERLRGY